MQNNFFNVIIILLVVPFGYLLSAQEINEQRPNFLFIISDDQDASTLGVYGDKHCDTPVIDRLSKKGMTLRSAYNMGSYSAAVCTPSRIMLMTGRNLWETIDYNIEYPPLDYVHKPEENYAKINPSDASYNSCLLYTSDAADE